MNMLQGSSKGLRRAIGLGLLGLALSIVPGGQASAAVSLSASDPVADGMTASGSQSGQILTITESWGTPVTLDTYTYSRTYGDPQQVYSTSAPALYDANGDAFLVDVNYSGASSSSEVITIRKEVTNNTGYAWTDFHWAFSYWSGNAWVPFDGAGFVAMDGTMGTMVWDGNSAHWVVTNQNQRILSPGGTGTFGITGDLAQIVAVTGGTGTLRIEQVPTVVPEPSTYLLMGIAGLFGAAMLRRKQAVEA